MEGCAPMLTKRPRGTRDYLPDQLVSWHHMESVARDLCARYGFGEIRTPVFEHTELFVRSVGEGTDIVDKEMYTFQDRGQRSLSLRPESTAPVMRAFLEAGLHNTPLPAKLFYLAYPCFRYERPQAARYRQHHQFGVEVIGSYDPTVDVEVMALAVDFLSTLGLSGFEIRLNSIGCPECRVGYREQLASFLAGVGELCGACQDRRQTNPLRVLDCKSPGCRQLIAGAPLLLDSLCTDCSSHLSVVRAGLEQLGLGYDLDPRLVRGLDYYTHTVFEVYFGGTGSRDALCGGGRYDGLATILGGDKTPGMGFGLGMERVLLALEEAQVQLPGPAALDVFLVTVGARASAIRPRLLAELRREGLSADGDFMDRSVRAQMKLASRRGARMVLMVGDEELERGEVTLRLLELGRQLVLPLKDMAGHVREALAGHDVGKESQP